MLVRRILVGLGVLLGVGLLSAAVVLRPGPPLDYTPHPPPHVADALAFRDARLAESAAAGVPDHNAERLVVHRAAGSDVVFLYVHGFSAARGEGELVVDTLAREWSANTWYLRLPGHGGPGAALGAASASEYFDTITDALGMARRLGDRTVVIATSTGATLAIWAAATYPEHVDALVLASPLVDYADPTAALLLHSAHAEWLSTQILGEERDVTWRHDPEGRKGARYDDHWSTRYPSRALVTLERVRRYASRPEVHAAVRAPTLLLYYYADDEHQDGTVSVDAARTAFGRFANGAGHPASRSVAIADGTHVLLSEHVRTDKAAVLAATRDFLRDVVGSPPRERALRSAPVVDQPPG